MLEFQSVSHVRACLGACVPACILMESGIWFIVACCHKACEKGIVLCCLKNLFPSVNLACDIGFVEC